MKLQGLLSCFSSLLSTTTGATSIFVNQRLRWCREEWTKYRGRVASVIIFARVLSSDSAMICPLLVASASRTRLDTAEARECPLNIFVSLSVTTDEYVACPFPLPSGINGRLDDCHPHLLGFLSAMLH
mmetsp:Transcript_5212/g.10005  ORF Transcript_5212/g.10005 Transcript_5212/m.10005 type:complete len:128 (-) Transcript_5212:1422-1805(-)